MTWDVLQEPKVQDTPPPPPPDVQMAPSKVVLPDYQVFPVDTPTAPTVIEPSTTLTQPPPVPTAVVPTAEPVHRVGGGPGKGFPASEDYYPPAAVRIGQTGTSTVQVCVAPSGQLTAPPAIGTSSGSTLLDQGALRLAKAGSGHYRPSTENGVAISSCFGLRITFDLKN